MAEPSPIEKRIELAAMGAAVAEATYRIYARQLVPGSGSPPKFSLIAASVCARTNIQPSEFKKLSIFDRIDILKSLVPAAPPKDATQSAPTASTKPKGRPRNSPGRVSIDARMYDHWKDHPESVDWTSRAWAAFVKCAKSAIEKTKSWKMMMGIREQRKNARKPDKKRRSDD